MNANNLYNNLTAQTAHPIEAVINQYINDYYTFATYSAYKRAKSEFADIINVLGKNPDKSYRDIKSIKPNDVVILIKKLILKGNCNNTINKKLKQIEELLIYARGLGYTNIYFKINRLPKNKAVRPTPCILPDEFIKIRRYFKDKNLSVLRDFCILAYYTGARLKEIQNFDEETFDLKRNEMCFYQSKTNKWRTIPIHKRILPIINRINDFKQNLPNKNGIEYQFELACNALNIKHLTPHAFRRGYFTQLKNKGAQDTDLIALGGHSNIKSANKYIKATDEIKNHLKNLQDKI